MQFSRKRLLTLYKGNAPCIFVEVHRTMFHTKYLSLSLYSIKEDFFLFL
jgi:hypothetical protein